MKKILAIPSLVFVAILLLASCSSTRKNTCLDLIKDNELSSPNQPIFRLVANDFEPWMRFILITQDSQGTQTNWGDVWIDDFGTITRRENECWTPLTIGCCDYGPGEFLDAWLVLPNGQQAFKAHIVPHPLMITQYGYNFYFEKDETLTYGWRLVGTGFDPGETVDVVTYADGSIYTDRLKANGEGEVIANIETWIEGPNGNGTRIDFFTFDGELSYTFPWKEGWCAYKQQFIEEKRRQDKEYRHDLIWTTHYR